MGNAKLNNDKDASQGDSRAEENNDSQAGETVTHPIASLAMSFIGRVNAMRLALRIAVPATVDHFQTEADAYRKKFENHIIEEDEKQFKVKIISDDVRKATEIQTALDSYQKLDAAGVIEALERSLFIGLFSEFDAFMGSLLELIYNRKPELFNEIKREISLSELLQFGSIDAVRQDMLEKEIDSFRRDSYIEQFGVLEKKFNIKTLRKFHEWPSFVEMGQRRNLITHNGGVVTEHYLSICEREGVSFSNRPVGTKLKVEPKYFFSACAVLSSVAFMLVYTLWRKLFPHETKEANGCIQNSVYELLMQKHWGLAARLGDFSLSDEMKKGADDLDVRIRHINLAIAQNKCNLRDEMIRTLEACDWSASVRDFKLAIAILKGEFSQAASLMRDIGKEGEIIDQSAYHCWPLFLDFVNTHEFQSAYREVYGHDFSLQEVASETTVSVVDPTASACDTAAISSANENTVVMPSATKSRRSLAKKVGSDEDKIKRVRRTRKAND